MLSYYIRSYDSIISYHSLKVKYPVKVTFTQFFDQYYDEIFVEIPSLYNYHIVGPLYD